MQGRHSGAKGCEGREKSGAPYSGMEQERDGAGCGVGALTVRCAKTFPKASCVGMDYWGKEWSYAKEQCEKNAKLEGVAARGHFQKGDAAKLDFPDETFDAVVSNFVFHEVRTAKDKRDVVRESLRVFKKGGAFSLQDMFAQKALYGDMEDLVK